MQAKPQPIDRRNEMTQHIKEIVVHGSHAAGMSKFLKDQGALLLRIDPPNKYVFIDDNTFQ